MYINNYLFIYFYIAQLGVLYIYTYTIIIITVCSSLMFLLLPGSVRMLG